ncbi:MAG TPA: YeeE/YedE family protein [Alphaproteobacteria bacterium]|nr:YeeE/YedE family protein [Alphaproteobacteria bacterium]
MSSLPVNVLVSVLGLLAGVVFGATAQRTNFCTMGAISDILNLQDYRRFRAWLLAIAVAIAGSQALYLGGILDLGKSIYLTANLGWLGAIVGGLLFGFGMTLTGGCGNKTLVRLGAGNLKSLVVTLVLAVFAFMTLRGLLGLARINFIESTNANLAGVGLSTQGIPDLLSASTGLSLPGLRWVVAVAAVLGLLWYCFKDPDFRASPANILGGAIIGALIPIGWAITGVIGADDFEPVPLASLTFVAPIGESLMYLMIFTGTSINFGIAAVGGVILGSFLMAVATRSFRVESFADRNDMLRHLAGGALMGTGGVLALGCTVGQGITGLSTLAFGSLLATLSIVAGAVYGLKYLEEGSLGGAFRAIVARG